MIDRSKIDRVAMIVVAIFLVIFGVSVFFDPIYFSGRHGARFNFGKHHQLIGFAIAVAGGLLLYYTTQKR